jgi:uncharacterized protein (TIGR02646 family)
VIRIHRDPTEPRALAAARASKLADLAKKVATGEKLLDADFDGYGAAEVKDALYKMHHRKCCYCEKRIEKENEDVEHFRPKRRANRVPGSRDRSGYWWLAFTWENLLFSCRQCNTKKGFKFPLRLQSGVLSSPVVLNASAPAPAASVIEWPLLIHPAHEQGISHIQFQREVYGNRPSWRPCRRDQSVKGACTIRHLRLDREALIEKYDRHVKRFIEPLLEPVREALKRQDRRALWSSFHKARWNIFTHEEEFLGLAYDAVRFFVPDEDLAKVNKDLRWPTADEIPLQPRTMR